VSSVQEEPQICEVVYAAPSPVTVATGENLQVPDDFSAPMGSEEYYRLRLEPALRRMVREAPVMARSLKLSQLFIFLAGIVASIFGATKLSALIPIVMGLSTLVTSIVHFNGYSACLSATNTAIATLLARKILWTSQSNFDRRDLQHKTELIMITENAILDVETAAARATAAAFGGVKGNNDVKQALAEAAKNNPAKHPAAKAQPKSKAAPATKKS